MSTPSLNAQSVVAQSLPFDRSDLAKRFAKTVTRDSPNSAVAWLAEQLWLALEAGHTALSQPFVCTGLTQLGFELEPTLASIRNHHAVQLEKNLFDERPIVFGYGYWYLQRYACLEQRIAQALRALDQEQPCPAYSSITEALTRLNVRQGEALTRATQRRLLVLSGGPGTGKTYTLAAIVAALRDALVDSQKGFRVVACAPTGKAAVRLANQGIHFDQVSTIQRLLSSARTLEGFIEADLLVVDEASMLDTTLADEFLTAIGPTTRLILAGDRNQLSAVRAGAVFSQLEVLSAARVELTESVRFEGQSLVGRLAQAILDGSLLETPLGADTTDLLSKVQWVVPPPLYTSMPPQQAWCDALVRGYSPLLELIAQPTVDNTAALAIFAQLSKFRALTATHEGPYGTKFSHEFLSRWFATRLRVLREQFSQPQLGRVITVTRNDELTGLRNGDVGVILNLEHGVSAVFEGADSLTLRSVGLSLLPEHEDGLVLTVHKSQGSEYGTVLFALPELGSPQARLELVYTAVTRAKMAIQLLGSAERLCSAVAQRSERFSGLAARLTI